jgi:hypothetical protein
MEASSSALRFNNTWDGSGTDVMTLNSNGNVGIGKAPHATYQCDVAGTINASNVLINGNAIGGSQWTTSGTHIYYNGANVGIGATANPISKLHIYDNTSAIVTIQAEDTSDQDITSSPSVSPENVSGDTADKYIMFTNTGASQTSYTINLLYDYYVDILVVGGGGGGGTAHGGGGGAGALIYVSETILAAGQYTILVGNGGPSAARQTTPTTGYDSSISFGSSTIYLAKGGGGGGHGNGSTGANGGSGGGGDTTGFAGGTAVNTNIPNGIYGNSGGNGETQSAGGTYAGGGGGGAGGNGAAPLQFGGNAYGGNGGVGRQLNITGTATYYAGGGGGGVFSSLNRIAGTGGSGGGGNGGTFSTGVDGTANTGGGGGGGGGGTAGSSLAGGVGGSGVVIIRYRKNKVGISEIRLVRGSSLTSGEINYKIGNYSGLFQIKTQQNSIQNTAITINDNGNIGIGSFSTLSNKLYVQGNMSVSGVKNWRIRHPILKNKYLIHTCIEGTRADNIYRGRKKLINGICAVNIDLECNTTGGMHEGTFELINKNVQAYVINNETFDRVIGKITGNILNIKCENEKAECFIDWLVIGERNDEGMITNSSTSEDGSVIVELDKTN